MSANVSPSKKALLLKSKPSLDATRWQVRTKGICIGGWAQPPTLRRKCVLYLSSLWATTLVSRPGRKCRCKVGHATRHSLVTSVEPQPPLRRLQKELMSLMKEPPPGVTVDAEEAGQNLSHG
uniref:UBC core domain-containing protein n=1 Tax=Timema bartmani TaxID=61472 RepID=A0A7R9F2L0_9NEOP|nr:unnamed protein product [Timema bartmani]